MSYLVGAPFPSFSLQACVSTEKGKEFAAVDQNRLKGQWNVIFFYPLDFTFVCPTELIEFNHSIKEFKARNAAVYGASGDSHHSHLAWRLSHPGLKDLAYPLLADYTKELSESLGILHPKDKIPLRATYIVDPEGTIRWVSINDLKVGRNVKEVLRTLDALQTEELCPCDWNKGKETIKI